MRERTRPALRLICWLPLIGLVALAGCEKRADLSALSSGGPAVVHCDSGLALDSTVPLDAAQAIGLCSGVQSAAWVLLDGTAPPVGATFHLGHGLLPDFGPNVALREGAAMLALSSGTARRPADPGYVASVNTAAGISGLDKSYSSTFPAGLPQVYPSCPAAATPHDSIALEVVLDVPAGATGFSMEFNYHSTDLPISACSNFTDGFVVLQDPAPPGLVVPNVAYDWASNPVSAASPGSMLACTPQSLPHATYACPLGLGPLVGTGFDGYGASGWLGVASPVLPGTVTLRIALWDGDDGLADSTVLVDNFRWF